jgi:hypothetical protein
MDFENLTAQNAILLRSSWGPDTMLGAVVARPTFRIEGTRLVETPDDPWPLQEGPIETPYGEFPAEMPFLSGGVDVFVVGNAYQPGGQPGPDLQMNVRIGTALDCAIDIFGDRVWEKRWGKLVQSDPEPFVSMPLTYARAYGGTLQIDEGMFGWPANPEGKGFYFTAEQAEGNPLPNLEDPEHPIESFEDRPDPLCPAPLPIVSGLRTLNAVELDLTPGEERIKQLKPLMFNNAHPRLIIEPGRSPRPGDTVEITCVRPDGDIRFVLPELSHHVHVQLEDRSYVFPLHLDLIGVIAEEMKVVLGYRVVFTYTLHALERRLCSLRPGPLPSSVPAEYVRTWES